MIAGVFEPGVRLAAFGGQISYETIEALWFFENSLRKLKLIVHQLEWIGRTNSDAVIKNSKSTPVPSEPSLQGIPGR